MLFCGSDVILWNKMASEICSTLWKILFPVHMGIIITIARLVISLQHLIFNIALTLYRIPTYWIDSRHYMNTVSIRCLVVLIVCSKVTF